MERSKTPENHYPGSSQGIKPGESVLENAGEDAMMGEDGKRSFDQITSTDLSDQSIQSPGALADKMFAELDEILKQSQLAHRKNPARHRRPFLCHKCFVSFKRKQHLIAHMVSHTDEKPYKCKFCSAKFPRNYTLTRHVKTIHPFEFYKMELDIMHDYPDQNVPQADNMEESDSKISMDENKDTDPSDEMEEPQIKVTDSPTELKVSLEKTSPEGGPFYCKICHKKYELKRRLKTHIIVHLKKTLICPLCNIAFIYRRDLIKHCMCQCNSDFHVKIPPESLPAKRKRDMSINPEDPAKKSKRVKKDNQAKDPSKVLKKLLKPTSSVRRLFTCQICNRAFKKKHHLRGHMTVHTWKKPFVCPYCSASFTRKASLERHMATHTLSCLCHICGRSFPTNKTLNDHLGYLN